MKKQEVFRAEIDELKIGQSVLKEILAKYDANIYHLKKQMDAISKNIVTEEKINEMILSKTKSLVPSSTTPMVSSEEFSQRLKEIVRKENDSKSRSNNLIIYRLDEKELNLDRATIINIFSKLDSTFDSAGIMKLHRIGKKQTDKTRPLLVELNNNKNKSTIMRNLKLLRDIGFGHISVSNDLTKSQREEHRKLVDEVKQLNLTNTNQNLAYKIAGPPGKESIRIVRKSS